MKNKTLPFILLGFVLVILLVNSCKKAAQGTIESVLTSSGWQLASVTQTTYLGDAILSTETLNANCSLTQIFAFKTDNSCTYTNFECIQQNASGKWALSPDKLTLYANLTSKDTTAAGSSQPFDTTRIVNLGLYSMVVETGPVSNFSTTLSRKIRRYGFVRQKSTN
jgi:hypothetical protein